MNLSRIFGIIVVNLEILYWAINLLTNKNLTLHGIELIEYGSS